MAVAPHEVKCSIVEVLVCRYQILRKLRYSREDSGNLLNAMRDSIPRPTSKLYLDCFLVSNRGSCNVARQLIIIFPNSMKDVNVVDVFDTNV